MQFYVDKKEYNVVLEGAASTANECTKWGVLKGVVDASLSMFYYHCLFTYKSMLIALGQTIFEQRYNQPIYILAPKYMYIAWYSYAGISTWLSCIFMTSLTSFECLM